MKRRKLILGIMAFISACRSKVQEERLDSAQKETNESFNPVPKEDSAAMLCEPQELSISLLEYPELRDVGGAAYVSFPDQFVHLLIICISAEEWAAVWKICTHGVCDVEWDSSLSLVRCPCHGSVFDIDGVVLQGPATRDLKSFAVCRENDQLFLQAQPGG